jgi:uncharacterized coiled-coil DUF342 family protein
MTEARDSNIGQTGVESIRIRGKRVEDLPLGQGNDAVAGLAEARETERLNKIATINKEFPPHRVDYLVSRIKECRENINRVNKSMHEQSTMINDYKGHISLCGYRDKEIEKLRSSPESGDVVQDKIKMQAKIKELRKNFPPYSVVAMEQQIVQCHEAIERCMAVIQQEQDSIAEFEGVLSLCRKRDIELGKYGARAEGS